MLVGVRTVDALMAISTPTGVHQAIPNGGVVTTPNADARCGYSLPERLFLVVTLQAQGGIAFGKHLLIR